MFESGKEKMKSAWVSIKKRVKEWWAAVVAFCTPKKGAEPEPCSRAEKSPDAGQAPDAGQSPLEAEPTPDAGQTPPQAEEFPAAGKTAGDWEKAPPHKPARQPLLHFLDFFASLVFMAVVIVRLKPSLLLRFTVTPEVWDSAYFKALNWLGYSFLKIDVSGAWGNSASMVKLCNLVVAVALMLFVWLKIVVILCCEDANRLVAFLLLVLFVMVCFLAPSQFLLFSAFVIVLYFTFQVACFLPSKALPHKFCWVTAFSLVLYFFAHVFLVPGFTENIMAIVTMLALPKVRLW